MKARVAQVITRLELGGAQQVALCLAGRLDRGRYDVTLITGGEDRLTPEARAIPDAELVEVPELVREVSPVNDLAAYFRLRAILGRLKDASPGGLVVHTHSSKAGILGRLAARAADADVIVHTIHGFGFNDEQSWARRTLFARLERLASGVSDALVAVAEDNIEKGVRWGVFDRGKAEVIRCGIPAMFFEAPAEGPGPTRRSLGIPQDAPVAVMVSCLKPQKAPLDFVRVAARVLQAVPDAHFVQAGDGELRDVALAEARGLGLGDRYHLLGWRDDVRDIIHASDVAVLTSLWEGLPLSVVQAMAAGKPVVATDVDGTPEVVKDGVNGFLARPHDVEAMAGKVALLFGDRGLARRMGEAGRAMAAPFDEAVMLRSTEELYERLLGGVS